MKKTLIALFSLAVILAAGAYAVAQQQQPAQPEQEFTIKLKTSEVNALFYCLDKSTAEHNLVAQVSQLIGGQVQKQAADTTKKK